MAPATGIRSARALRDVLLGGDVPLGGAVLDDGSLLHVPGRSGFAGQYQGGEAILGLLNRMAHLSGATLHFDLDRVAVADEHAIVLSGHTSAARRGTRLETDAVHVLTFAAARVREIWVFHADQQQVDDFWQAHGERSGS